MEEAPQAETLDRKELLEQQFEQADETPTQGRDEQGRAVGSGLYVAELKAACDVMVAGIGD